MTLVEYNELIEMLNNGHEVEFECHGKYYYLERGEHEHILYEKSCDDKEIQRLCSFVGDTVEDRVDAFLDKKMFNLNTFDMLYSEIQILDVD